MRATLLPKHLVKLFLFGRVFEEYLHHRLQYRWHISLDGVDNDFASLALLLPAASRHSMFLLSAREAVVPPHSIFSALVKIACVLKKTNKNIAGP